MLEVLAEDLGERGEVDLSECFIGGTFLTVAPLEGRAVAGVAPELSPDSDALRLSRRELPRLETRLRL